MEREFAQNLARENKSACWRGVLAAISSETVVEWQAYYAKHGFSHEMDSLRAGMICASNYNVTAIAAGIKLDEPLSPHDFMPNHKLEKPEQDEETMMAMAIEAGGMRFERGEH
ncbi:phage tail assembly protein T (plasmid) [Vibrio metschnikovii]|uniref:phage tail assembly protein T n=1 Tax=Vibrio metschnikovii TaxID=28172 RepID=UPI00315DA325